MGVAYELSGLMNMNVERCEILVDTILDAKLQSAPSGINYAEKIGHFEKSLDSSLSLLREAGFIARAKREEYGEKIYFNISIE